MAFNGQTLTDYGTRPTYSVPAFTSTFLTKLSSFTTTVSSPVYNDIEIALNTSLVSPRLGRASDSIIDRSISDIVSKSYQDAVKLCGESGAYVSDYEENSLWQMKTYADDLHKIADLDRRVWVLQNQIAMKDRERLSVTGIQDASLIHKSSEKGYERTAKEALQSDKNLWEAAESLLDRGLATTLQDDEQTHRGTESGYLRTHKTTLQNDRQSWEAGESVLDRAAELNLQNADQAHKTSESAYARGIKVTLANDQFAWEVAESVLERAADTTLLTTTLAEKLLIEQEKMSNEEDMKRLEWNLDVWKINSYHYKYAGWDLAAWGITAGCPLFWDWTDGSLSITNPW